MSFVRKFAALTAAAGLVLTVPALAHTHVISSTPAAAATASNVRNVTITFSEPFMPALSGLEVVMTGMPGMAGHHPAMKVNGIKVAPSSDRKSL